MTAKKDKRDSESITVRFPRGLFDDLEVLSEAEGISIREMIKGCVQLGIDRKLAPKRFEDDLAAIASLELETEKRNLRRKEASDRFASAGGNLVEGQSIWKKVRP